MRYAAAVCLGKDVLQAGAGFRAYWETVARITSLLQAARISHVIIKTRRCYPYGDTNVDVFIDESDWPTVRRILCGNGWRLPSRGTLFKQRLIEREKIKLPALERGIVPAHLYMSVSWRYQREVSFLDPDMIEEVPIVQEAPELGDQWNGLLMPIPSRAADILLHCAEIVFENYRLSFGEALYLMWLLETVPRKERLRTYRLGVERGAAIAMRCVFDHLPAESALKEGVGVSRECWPSRLPPLRLLRSWNERFRVQRKGGRTLAAMEEWFGYATFATLYRVKRAVWK